VTQPDFLRDLVLPHTPMTPLDQGTFDVYLPGDLPRNGGTPAPLVVLVHGGPLREVPSVTPRQWPLFQGYAAALAERGVAAVTFDHPLLASLDYAGAAERVRETVDRARACPGVDGSRVALWYFSGGGPLAADVLGAPPEWLRAVLLSYPALSPFADVAGFQPADQLAAAGRLPILLTRVEGDYPALAEQQAAFVAAAQAAGADLTIIDVAGAQHSFDVLDDTDESRRAIEQALEYVGTRLG
jgi:acetyl esterase/lipase